MEQTFTPKKFLSFDSQEEVVPNMEKPLTDHMWLKLIKVPSDYYPEVVLEFYTANQATQDALGYKGNVDSFTCLSSVMVRGVEVDITSEAINYLYWTEPVGATEVYAQNIATKSDEYSWVVRTIYARS